MMQIVILVLLCIFLRNVQPFPDPGLWSASHDQTKAAIFGTHKPLYSGSSIYLSVNCESHSTHQMIELQWVLRQTSCYEDYLASNEYTPDELRQYFLCPMSSNSVPKIRFYISEPHRMECSSTVPLPFTNATFITFSDKITPPPHCENSIYRTSPNTESQIRDIFDVTSLNDKENNTEIGNLRKSIESSLSRSTKPYSSPNGILLIKKRFIEKQNGNNFIINYPQIITTNESYFSKNYHNSISGQFSSSSNIKLGSKLTTVDMDGIYLFILRIKSVDGQKINVSADVAMKNEHGYLSAVDYPLLIFYGVMCGLYVMYALAWLVMSALQWRDLIRIQFWIGAVIFLGLIEKAVFYAEYQSINYTGLSVQGAILFAEILSCMKRTLARMLIIIVSLGFGIVKPRLGSSLQRIIGVGALYFTFGSLEGCLRVLKPKPDPGNQALMAGIPLAVTDGIICWWIFSSLVQTIRTLRLRRNVVKLQLYKHFTNTLILSVIGSVAFMIWAVHAHRLISCIEDWKGLWVDEAYWHFLFSTILFVIMILWRPTNNNQRYAFTPLLDPLDDDEDDEENSVINDAFDGIKIRTVKNNSSVSQHIELESKSKEDEDLKWVEENILTDVALPTLLDSDEEIMTAKFERSKME